MSFEEYLNTGFVSDPERVKNEAQFSVFKDDLENHPDSHIERRIHGFVCHFYRNAITGKWCCDIDNENDAFCNSALEHEGINIEYMNMKKKFQIHVRDGWRVNGDGSGVYRTFEDFYTIIWHSILLLSVDGILG